jgi:hypothetical protein
MITEKARPTKGPQGAFGSIEKKFKLSNMSVWAQCDRSYKTVACDFSMSMVFNSEHPDIKALKPKNAIDYISSVIENIKKDLWNETKGFLNPIYFPTSLHKDVIIVSNDQVRTQDDSSKNASSYFYNKLSKNKMIGLNLGIYFHTSNAIKHKREPLLEFVYFDDSTRQNEQTQNIEDFIHHISNSSTLNHSGLFTICRNNYTPRKNKIKKEEE